MTAAGFRVMMPGGGANMVVVDRPVRASASGERRFTVDEYLVMAEALDLERTELIDGVVYEVAAEHSLHGRTVMRVLFALARLFGEEAIWAGATVRLGGGTAIQPDVFVTEAPVVVHEKAVVEADALRLAVEVSVTTRDDDLGRKLRIYADAGVAEYWVIDPREGKGWLQRHAEPSDGLYASVQRFDVGFAAEHLDAAAVLAGTGPGSPSR
jgi:Uma2 family endonuclease